MRLRLGPGPVFVYESITAARRWQNYAWRALFVTALLVALGVAWQSFDVSRSGVEWRQGLSELARLGAAIYWGVAGTQLALVLLVAPAATAGAICLDRARGGLEHMLVTDLSDTEIVLGKLAARLLPVAALVASGIPVLALATLLGGISPWELVVLTLVTAAVAVLCGALALALSTRATKTHEVLMAAYAVEVVWLAAPFVWRPICYLVTGSRIFWQAPAVLFKSNPFVLVYAPYTQPNFIDVADVCVFLAVTLTLSLAFVMFAVVRLRAAVRPARRRSERWEARLRAARAVLISWWPSPSLDGNPVLWREWHRNRPSRMGRLVMRGYLLAVAVGMAMGVHQALNEGVSREDTLQVTSFLAVTFGLLILSATAPTALTEERVRGSLDVLMSTPLSTRSIVLGKWWALYRRWLPLALAPALTGLFVSLAAPDRPGGYSGPFVRQIPLSLIDRVAVGVIPLAFALAHAAAATSLGLALGTWIRRTGLAITLSIAAYLFMLVGWVACVEALLIPYWRWYEMRDVSQALLGFPIDPEMVEYVASVASPMGSQLLPGVLVLNGAGDADITLIWAGQVVVLAMTAAVAAGLLGLTLATFNRCLGRVSEHPGPRRPVVLRPVRRGSGT